MTVFEYSGTASLAYVPCAPVHTCNLYNLYAIPSLYGTHYDWGDQIYLPYNQPIPI